jgi:hypothetical protein
MNFRSEVPNGSKKVSLKRSATVKKVNVKSYQFVTSFDEKNLANTSSEMTVL